MFGSSGDNKPLNIFGPRSKLSSNHLYGWQSDLKKMQVFEEEYQRTRWDRNQSQSYIQNPGLQRELLGAKVSDRLKTDFFQKSASNLEGWRGNAARGIVSGANRVNDYLSRKSRGYIEGGFKTVGEVVAAAPLKSLGRSYVGGLGIMGVFEFGLSGKPITLSNLAHTATDNVAFTLGAELAGTGMKGMAKYMGWQAIGSELGLGTWGSLGLQIGGSLAMPGLGWGLGAGMLAYKAGKGLFQGLKGIHDLGQRSRQTEFLTKDNSWQSANAATMRERALGAIQNSHLNLRSVLGNEARMLMMAR